MNLVKTILVYFHTQIANHFLSYGSSSPVDFDSLPFQIYLRILSQTYLALCWDNHQSTSNYFYLKCICSPVEGLFLASNENNSISICLINCSWFILVDRKNFLYLEIKKKGTYLTTTNYQGASSCNLIKINLTNGFKSNIGNNFIVKKDLCTNFSCQK